jgi:Kef-type K+ transport system membrane component KefB
MGALHYDNLLIVVAVAFAAPFVLGFAPKLRFPAVVLEIVLGIVIGPSGLGWVKVDEPIAVLALLGLAFLLFLAGLEIDFTKLRGRVLRLALGGFALSFAIGVGVGVVLKLAGYVQQPLFAGIVLSATSLGIVIPLLKDSGDSSSSFGQLVIAAGSIADFGAIILLTLFFSKEATGTGTKIFLLGSFLALAVVAGVAVKGAERSPRITATVNRLANTTAQIRIRGAFVLLVAFAALAEGLGLEVILGAFAAGAIIKLADPDEMMLHAEFRTKLEGIGYGVFIPVFFVASGLRFDLDALTSSASTVARVPIFLLALVVVRGLPALLYRDELDNRHMTVAALLQATSLPFIVAATQIGLGLHVITAGNAAAFTAAGLLSVMIFPATAVGLLGGGGAPDEIAPTPAPA